MASNPPNEDACRESTSFKPYVTDAARSLDVKVPNTRSYSVRTFP